MTNCVFADRRALFVHEYGDSGETGVVHYDLSDGATVFVGMCATLIDGLKTCACGHILLSLRP